MTSGESQKCFYVLIEKEQCEDFGSRCSCYDARGVIGVAKVLRSIICTSGTQLQVFFVFSIKVYMCDCIIHGFVPFFIRLVIYICSQLFVYPSKEEGRGSHLLPFCVRYAHGNDKTT